MRTEKKKEKSQKRKQWTKKQSEKPRTRATMGGGGVDNALTTGEQTIPPPILFRNNPQCKYGKKRRKYQIRPKDVVLGAVWRRSYWGNEVL